VDEAAAVRRRTLVERGVDSMFPARTSRRTTPPESFNGKFRAECPNANWCLSLDDARLKCEAWRMDYNEVRPRSAIGNQTPVARAFASGQACLT
jgi:transposase InsO family protein